MTQAHIVQPHVHKLPLVAQKLGGGPTERLVALAINNTELFHTPEREPYAMVPLDVGSATLPLKSRDFRYWLSQRFFEDEGWMPKPQALRDASTQAFHIITLSATRELISLDIRDASRHDWSISHLCLQTAPC
jgi:hypothetical protein